MNGSNAEIEADTIKRLADQIERLNNNLERLIGMQGELGNFVEIMADLRAMIATMAGFRVKK